MFPISRVIGNMNLRAISIALLDEISLKPEILMGGLLGNPAVNFKLPPIAVDNGSQPIHGQAISTTF